MAGIRYVCISDLHLGASNSILTSESMGGAPGCTAQPLELLASCLRTIAGRDRPQLVINGDIVFLAGNHDHHLWEGARETWYREALGFAWIDFFWSTLGRSGAAGADIFLIYDKLHDLNALKQLMGGLQPAS